jgi:hypothetical protein
MFNLNILSTLTYYLSNDITPLERQIRAGFFCLIFYCFITCIFLCFFYNLNRIAKNQRKIRDRYRYLEKEIYTV